MNEFSEAGFRDHFRLQLAVAAALALAVLVWMSWDAFNDYIRFRDSLAADRHMQLVGSELTELEDATGTSARMAAADGDSKWHSSYQKAEHELDAIIGEARLLQPDAARGTAAERVESSRNAMASLQHRALDLVRQARKDEAREIISSDAYEQQRELYSQGVKEFNANYLKAHDTIRQDIVDDTRQNIFSMGASTLLLVLGTLFATRATRRWEMAMTESNRLLNRKTIELEELNESLDRKVEERTKDLEESAIASLNMMEDAIRRRQDAERANEELDYLSSYDPLTGLANRRLFLERVAEGMRIDAGNDKMLALFLIDLERFKNINDSLGQPAGDELLRQVARWLERHVGDASQVARLGADHFGIVLPVVPSESGAAKLLEETLVDLKEQPFALGDSVFRIAAKAGAALFPADGDSADSLYRNAEAALKKAKAAGEKYLFYTQAMTDKVGVKVTMENQLRSALDNDEYVLHYQPKVNLASGKITGVEALIRWNDPRTGLVPPFHFIPILEETGMIHDVGRWAMRKAVADYLRWRSEGLLAVPVAVNVSSLQLRNRGFIAEIEQTLGIDARAVEGLELEITESMVMEDIKQSIASLQAIRAMGVTIAIDDFGTGFSSLGYLAKLPIDVLKIDRSFVIEMEAGPHGMSLVQTIINLAKSLDLKTVAEGVETEEQARLLQLLRADEIQGYLFSKPVPSETLEEKFLGRDRSQR